MENNRIQLEDLRPAQGATHKKKRKGRGIPSGHGKTSCRGHRGEGQRSGNSQKRGFEGGQMPAYRKVPKLKGFSVPRPIIFAEVNVAAIESLELEIVNLEALKEKGMFSKKYEALRILGNGEIKKAVKVQARYFTKAAQEKIEKAGGSIEVV